MHARNFYLYTQNLAKGVGLIWSALYNYQCASTLESIARINELDKSNVKSIAGKTPNVKNAINNDSTKVYGILSEIAHFGTPDVGSKLRIFETGDKVGPSIYPRFHDDAFQLYGINTYLDILFFSAVMNKLTEWYPDYNVERLDSALEFVVRAAVENDIIILK